MPGDADAAARRAGELGLGSLLASLLPGGKGSGGDGGDVPDIAGDMSDGYLGVVSRVLAGWDEGTAEGELGDMLAEAVADGDYAELLSLTQVTVVGGQAALGWYLANGGQLLAWQGVLDSRICPACLANASADPRPAGVPWPSGDVAPPVHGNGCRCALVAAS